MSKVPRKETKQEQLVAKFLFSKGIRYKKNYKELPGSPDIAITKMRKAIFVHGCFWHGHNCQYGKLPSTNIDFWSKKINDNKLRDSLKKDQLSEMGWKVIEIWQCELRNKETRDDRLSTLMIEIFDQ